LRVAKILLWGLFPVGDQLHGRGIRVGSTGTEKAPAEAEAFC
jgi:hypothetical protein